MEMPRSKPLLYVGIGPASIEGGPEELYLAHSTPRYSATELQCLAEALYFESRGESRQGQAAVAEVILNRVESRAFPSTVCAVVNQPMQFSYTIGGRKTIRNKTAYQRVLAVAKEALKGAPRVLTNGATYFHTPSVRPAWSYRFQRTARIGQHIFYRGQQRIASN
ncbi:cell wall hydrolase [Paracoccus methylarcula]|uniref:Cell wall hydrolase n=2 Tax=Paracoccus methylarcula TaxID=72022 RepID=A0A3R7PR85_9RHOB|nr:cell wall hydrolase [Paracoccus methylarcula]